MAEAIEKTVITLDDANPRPLQDSTVPLSSPTPTISVTDISAPACLQSAPPPESQHIWIKPFQCSHNSNYLETISGALTEAGYCVLDEAEKSNADCWLIIQCSAQGPSPKAVGNLVLQGKELGRTVIIAGCDQSREQGDKDAASKLDPGPSLVEKISGGVVTQLLHKKASPKVDTCQEVASQPSHLKSAAPPYSININKSTEAETAEAGEDPPNQSTNSVSELETNSATIIESVPEENYKDQASKAGGSSGGGEAKEILIHSKSEAARPSLLDLDAPSNPQRMEDKAVEIEPQLQSAAAVRVEAVRFDPGLTEHLIVGGLVVGLLGTLISGLLKLFEHVFNS